MVDLLDGRYEVHVTAPAVSGEYQVTVQLRGYAIQGSPHALEVLPEGLGMLIEAIEVLL